MEQFVDIDYKLETAIEAVTAICKVPRKFVKFVASIGDYDRWEDVSDKILQLQFRVLFLKEITRKWPLKTSYPNENVVDQVVQRYAVTVPVAAICLTIASPMLFSDKVEFVRLVFANLDRSLTLWLP